MNEIKIHILHCGRIWTDISVPEGRGKMVSPVTLMRNKKNRVCYPVSAYLIEHPKGNVLFDTGWNREVRTNQEEYLGPVLSRMMTAELPEGEAVDEQLAARGFMPTDLDYIVLSHMDADHISGLKMLGGAKNVLVSKSEAEAAKKLNPRYHRPMWSGVKIKTFRYTEPDYGPFNRYLDLFGDGTVLLSDMNGHSVGQTALTVQREGKYAVFFADAGYSSYAWKNLTLPGLLSGVDNARKCILWIRDTSMRPNCVGSFANHDPEVEPQTIII